MLPYYTYSSFALLDKVSYAAKYVKEYVEESKPVFSVGEYWDTCNYSSADHRLDYNQGMRALYYVLLDICDRWIKLSKVIKLKYLYYSWMRVGHSCFHGKF